MVQMLTRDSSAPNFLCSLGQVADLVEFLPELPLLSGALNRMAYLECILNVRISFKIYKRGLDRFFKYIIIPASLFEIDLSF